MTFFRLCSLLVVLFFSAGGAMAASSPDLLGAFGRWQAFQYQDGAGLVCFASTVPDKLEGAYKRRDPVYLMVTHRPAEQETHVVSFLAGYSYAAGAEVKVSVDGQSFLLMGQDNTAWAPDAVIDKKLVAALKRGNKVVVEGKSARGTPTKDTFLLKGSGDAVGAIDKACGL